MKSNAVNHGRTFVLGAGISAEVGAPTVSAFLAALLGTVPESRRRLVEDISRSAGNRYDIEMLLSRIDEAIQRGESWRGFSVPRLRRVRRELVNGISETLSKVQFEHLRQHFGLRRYENPYYYESRRFRLLETVKKDLPRATFDKRAEAMQERALTLRDARSLDETDWAQSVDAVLKALFDISPHEDALRLLVAALYAAGRERAAKWIVRVWPLAAEFDLPGLAVPRQPWDRGNALNVIDGLIALAEEAVARSIKSARPIIGWLRDIRQDVASNDLPPRYELQRWLLPKFASDVLGPLSRKRDWLSARIEELLALPATYGVDPYILLASQLRPGDGIITLNYDLFAELALGVLRTPNADLPNYAVPDLLTLIPWHPDGPLMDYRYLGSSGIPVLKLHGSINWLECAVCGKAYCFIDTPARGGGPQRALEWTVAYYVRQYGARPCCIFFRGSRAEIRLVPPTFKKDIRLGFLADVWLAARDLIARSRELIFIGYSLSPSDHDVRQLFRNALELRQSGKLDEDRVQAQSDRRSGRGLANRPLKVTVVNRTGRSSPNFVDFFGSLPLVNLAFAKMHASKYLEANLLQAFADAARGAKPRARRSALSPSRQP